MAIFGYSKDMAHNATSLDTAMNYTYGTLLLVAIPIALTLNPVVFYYNRKQKQTLVAVLFQVLAVVDFIFLVRPINAVYNLLKPQLDPVYIPNPKLGRRLVCIVTYTFGYMSMSMTLTLCVVRYIMIRFPFWAMSNGTLLKYATGTAVLLDIIWNCGVAVFVNFSGHEHVYVSPTQSVWDVPPDDALGARTVQIIRAVTVIGPFFLKIGLSVLFSLLTVAYLRSDTGQQIPEVKRRSVNMIVLLNVGNAVWCVVSLAVQFITRFGSSPLREKDNPEWKYWFFYLQFVEAVLMQSLLVAYHPLVVCARNTGVRKMLRDLVRYGKVDVPQSQTPTDDAINAEKADHFLARSLSNMSAVLKSRFVRNQRYHENLIE